MDCNPEDGLDWKKIWKFSDRCMGILIEETRKYIPRGESEAILNLSTKISYAFGQECARHYDREAPLPKARIHELLKRLYDIAVSEIKNTDQENRRVVKEFSDSCYTKFTTVFNAEMRASREESNDRTR